MPNYLTAAECRQVLAVTHEQIENAVLALAGIEEKDVNLADPDKAFVLRELRLTMDTALKEWKAKESEVMARVTPGGAGSGYYVETKTQDTVNTELAKEEQPEFWEAYAYVPAEAAQRREGRINQRNALRELYGLDTLPEETVRVQDVKDYLPLMVAERILNRDAKLVGKAVLLEREGEIFGHEL